MTTRYFGVSKVAEDQVEDYTRRKNIPIAEQRRWLAPVLDETSAKIRRAD